MGIIASLLSFVAALLLTLGGTPSAAGTPDRGLPWQTADARVPHVEYRTFDSRIVGTPVSYHAYVPEAGASLPELGLTVTLALDWPRRLRLMRMHTTLHLLCSLIPGAGVTGGQIGLEKSRLDFDLPEPPSKESLTEGLNALIAANHPITQAWITEAELDANPGLVRTLSVQPPRGAGRIRLVRIGSADAPIDLQPCGGTHVRHTGEIGRVEVTKIENKGRQNRRVSLVLMED